MTERPIGDRRRLDALPGGGFAYVFLDDAIRIEARYLRRDHHTLHAEVDVQCEWAGASRHDKSLSCADQNLSSQTARRALAKYCAERAHTNPEAFDWMGAIDSASIEIIRAARRSDDVIVLDDAPDLTHRDFSVCGVAFPADAASLLIAHGDSLKSMVTLFLLGSLAQRDHRVLYVDWEWTADRHKRRKERLFGPIRMPTLQYLRCHAPLVVECDRLRRHCDEHRIEYLAIDSVAPACDGKLIDDDVANRFHRALANLPPALCTAHVPKSSLSPEHKGDPIGPFGSVFFSNLCRASWLLKKQPGASDDVVTVGLFPQKQNDGERVKPVGLEFTFGERIEVRPVNLADVEGLSERLPLAARISHSLQSGPLSFAQLAEQLDAKTDSVVKAVTRAGAKYTRVTGTDGITRIALAERRVA
jgi:hypothetical protein